MGRWLWSWRWIVRCAAAEPGIHPYQSRMNGYAVGRQNGWMSANDIRELENLDRIPAEQGGDLYLVNGNMIRMTDAVTGVKPETAETR